MESQSNKPEDKIGEYLLDCIFPRFCVGCHEESSFLCPDCQDKIIQIKTTTCLSCQRINEEGVCSKCKKQLPITKSIVLGYHKDPILKELVHNLKYEGLYQIADILSNMLIKKLEKYQFPKDYAIIPVPLHKKRYAQRGFNQSELIAKKIADYFDWTLNSKILIRQKNTKPQINLKHNDRLTNMKDAFNINPKVDLPGGTIILFDDVVTTGATVGECAKVLRQAGATRIWVIALAHG